MSTGSPTTTASRTCSYFARTATARPRTSPGATVTAGRRCGRNAVIDFNRRRSVRPSLPAHEADEDPQALTDSIEQAVLRWQVAAALERLTPEHREVVRLAHFQGLTLREVAERTGIPLGTVKSRASYALRGLRLALEGKGGGA